MDISDIVSADFEQHDPETTVSRLIGVLEDPAVKGVVIGEGDDVRGVVTRRQLVASHHPPGEKARSIVWPVPRVAPNEDVREVARLMVESESQVLPVFSGRTLEGVVAVDHLLRVVAPNFEDVTVGQVYTDDLVTVGPDATFGEALHLLREHRFTHLPVVSDDRTVGVLSLYDVVGFTTRDVEKSAGGESQSVSGHGGFGAREGERERMLALPVRDVMTEPALTVETDVPMSEALETMLEANVSSLVVVSEAGEPLGIVTKTDALAALTWEAPGNRAVQIYGMDLLDDVTYEDVVALVDGFGEKGGDLNVIDAKVHLHEHDEKLRGTPLLLARIRLYTDRGLYIASGEGYGAGTAIREAGDVLERRIREERTNGQTKKHPDEDYWERRFGWWLTS